MRYNNQIYKPIYLKPQSGFKHCVYKVFDDVVAEKFNQYIYKRQLKMLTKFTTTNHLSFENGFQYNHIYFIKNDELVDVTKDKDANSNVWYIIIELDNKNHEIHLQELIIDDYLTKDNWNFEEESVDDDEVDPYLYEDSTSSEEWMF
jgi:hypothetical protein